MDQSSRVMNSYIRIWLIAAVINAVVSTIIMILPSQQLDGLVIFVFLITLVCSLVMSIPILVLAMIISICVLSTHIWENVFYIVLSVTFIVSIIGALLFKDFLSVAESNPIMLGISIVIAAVTAVILSREKLKAISVTEE